MPATEASFRSLTSEDMVRLINGARRAVCYAGPGIRIGPAKAMLDVANRLGPSAIFVCIDFDERAFRLGYGDIEAVKALTQGQVSLQQHAGMRTGLLVVDDEGFVFTPTPLYLEAEPTAGGAVNAMRLTREQCIEAQARLSPAAKLLAQAGARDPQERERITALPAEFEKRDVSDKDFMRVSSSLAKAPPVAFDVVRQVRVFEPYLQYVEMSLAGAAIQRCRIAVPPNIQRLAESKELERRMHTTIELIKSDSTMSSKLLEGELNELRKLTPPLGAQHGRAILKANKPLLEERVQAFRNKLKVHQSKIESKLQKALDDTRHRVVKHFLPLVVQKPPDEFRAQTMGTEPINVAAERWLHRLIGGVFPQAKDLVSKMRLEVRYKDFTFETLSDPTFLVTVKKAFPDIDWDETYAEFRAARQSKAS